jgi:hypothetical protein
MKRYLAGAAIGLLVPATTAILVAYPASADTTVTAAPAAAMRCHASMSNSRPADYTTIYVDVSTVRHASITTVAHYKTVNRKHTGTANAAGSAKIRYYISGATPGYRVDVSVTVASGGSRGSCSTSFIPHR